MVCQCATNTKLHNCRLPSNDAADWCKAWRSAGAAMGGREHPMERICIRDKVEGTHEIPATPYMLHLLATLPRRNEWVFSSPTSATGCLSEPNTPHTRACKAAGLDGLTLHGLRRSFSSLTEWLETPAGVVAQIQGHKPSATAEKHYKVRPLELLRGTP